jgi:hypothetical protein
MLIEKFCNDFSEEKALNDGGIRENILNPR